MHEHEIEITEENFMSLLLESRILGKHHEKAFLEQCTRQGLDIKALDDKMLNYDKLFKVEKIEE